MSWAYIKIFKKLINYILVLFAISFNNAVFARQMIPFRFEYAVGQHYQLLDQKTMANLMVKDFQDPKKVQFLEFFSYGCYACQQMRLYFDAWYKKTPPYVEVHRFPLGLRGAFLELAKIYYVSEELNVLDSLDSKLFEAIHQKRINLLRQKKLEEFFIQQGIKKTDFKKVYNSFTVSKKLDNAKDIVKALQIPSTPTIVIIGPKNGYMTDIVMAGGLDNLLLLVKHLIKLEHEEIIS